MDYWSILLVIPLILPVFCPNPAEYGFTDNGGGSYYKDGANKEDGSRYRIWMEIDAYGNAKFSRQGNSFGNGVGSYDMANNLYYAEGYDKRALPLSGWDIGGASTRFSSRRQTTGVSTGYDDTGFQAGMDGHRRGMEAMQRSTDQMRGNMGRGFGGDGRNTQTMGGSSTINNFGSQVRGKNNGGVYGSFTGTTNTNNFDDYYGIKYSRTENNDDCTEKIVILGVSDTPTSAINDEFRPKCTKGEVRALRSSGNQLLVGGFEQNFCAYGQTDFPDQLVVIEDGVCKIKTYSLKTSSSKVKKLETTDCKKIKSLIKSVQDVLEDFNGGNTDNVRIEKQKQLKGLVKTLGTGGVDDTTSTRPGASVQRGWLQRLWIFIKNVFRVLTFQRTKDE